MKQLILINIIFALLTTAAHAATVSVGNIDNIHVANTLIGSSSSSTCETIPNQVNCDFLKTGPTEYLTNSMLEQTVTSNPATYALSPFRDNAYIDLGFDGFDIYNGKGNDLVVFIVGNTTSFGLDVFDKSGELMNSGIYSVATPTFSTDLNTVLDEGDTVLDNNGNWLCVNGADAFCTDGAALSAIFIDLGDDVAGDIALGNIRILLGNDFNGLHPTTGDPVRPRLSLAGGFHTEATVVPLPLSVVLFGSGLAMLGWVGRRKIT